jgi:ketosteroid isomerase-like protein
MSTFMRLFTTLAVLASSNAVNASPTWAQTTSDEQAIRALDAREGPYTDDSFFFSGAYNRPLIGKEPPPADRGGVRKGFKMVDKIDKLRVSKSGDLAYAYGTSTLSWEGQKPFDAAFLRVYRKEGGSWKVAALFQRPVEPEGAPPVLRVREGDTAFVAVHKVRPEARAEYERFMSQRWYPAAKRLANKNTSFADAFGRRWRLVGVEPGSDSLLTYMFVYPAYRESPASTWDIYRAGGTPDAEVARDSTSWVRWARTEGFVMVRDEY